jgi:UDP-glucose 4-epimerase
MLKAAHRSHARKFVYAASSTVYGRTPPPHRELNPPDCLNPYALTKYVGEQYCELYDRLYGLPTLSLRYFQVYGPRQPSSGDYAVVSGIFLEQRKSGAPLTIHGDGSQRRDFVYVGDVAEANIRALESPVHGTVINVGTGTSHSIKEIADLISVDQVVGMPRRPGDMNETRADTSRCHSLLQWCPSTPLVPTLLGLMAS